MNASETIEKGSPRQLWQLFVKDYGRAPTAMAIAVLSVITSLLEGLNLGLIVPLLENLGSDGNEGGHWISQVVKSIFGFAGIPYTLGSILVALSLIMLSLTILKFFRMLLTESLQMGFITWIRSRYMDNLLHADLRHFHGERLGVMTDTLTIQSWAAGSTIFYVIESVSIITVTFAYLAAAFLITPGLAGLALTMILIIFVSMRYFISKASLKAADQVGRQNHFQVGAVESLSGVHVIKSFLLEEVRSKDFSMRSKDVGDIHYDLFKNQSYMMLVQEVIMFGLVCSIVFVGVAVLGLGVAAIVALLFILFRLMPKVTTLNNMRQQMAQGLASVNAVTVAMERTGNQTIVSGEKPFISLDDSIEFRNVDFTYDGSGQVLRSTSFSAQKGKMTSIVGASGAGKSTLIDLLLRHYDPVGGQILVDGVNLKELDLKSWRGNIGLVSQDVFLFNESIGYNIGLNRKGISQEQIEDAAKNAFAHDFIMELPNGYATEIGDRGWNLSGGQRQRLSLARAIVCKPRILILDEATSSLDSVSEGLIQRYIKKIKSTSTLIVVAHRTATIRDSDKIVVLRDGKIVEEGTWNSLVNEAGIFAQYQLLQSGD